MKTIASLLRDLNNDALVGASVFLGIVNTFFLKYVFSDFEFLYFLLGLLSLDTLLGVFYAFREKDFDDRQFWDFGEKIIVYFAVMVVGHVLKNYTVDGQTNSILSVTKYTLYTGLVLREAGSILRFVGRKIPGFAKGLLKYFRGFNEEGLPENLTTKKP